MIFFLIFSRLSFHFTLQANKSFKPLAIKAFAKLQSKKIFTKYSTYHSLSADTGFKSLAIILFEILTLQNCDVKFQIFQRAITQN